ncbi:MAG: hypothetical protein ACYCX4_03810, partial [Bacillota bacterium]
MSEDIQIWRYYIPSEDGLEGWGIFLLDSTGMFAAVTDYGNYAFRWAYHGEKDFRKFVIGLKNDPGYLLGKVLPNGKVYDGEETIKNIKETIIDVRRDGSWSKEQARKEWDLLDSDLEYEYG